MGELYRLDFPNGKSYVGVTSKTAEERFLGHKKAIKHECIRPVYDAWREFGEPRLVLLAVVERREMHASEIRAIKAFETLWPSGYNISEGGTLSPAKHPEARRKMSEKSLAAWADPEMKGRMSNAMRGNTNRKGQPNSLEHNAKVSSALAGKPFTEAHKEALRKSWAKSKAAGLRVAWNKGLKS